MLPFSGISGQEISLVTNFFAMTSRPDFAIYHYHVTYSPEIDSRGRRGFLLKAHKQILRGYVFDGLHLFSSVQYHPEVQYFMFKESNRISYKKIHFSPWN
jgi:aubergine